jgi:cell division protein ZapA (FtsZ GTPase activity inhibitor)
LKKSHEQVVDDPEEGKQNGKEQIREVEHIVDKDMEGTRSRKKVSRSQHVAILSVASQIVHFEIAKGTKTIESVRQGHRSSLRNHTEKDQDRLRQDGQEAKQSILQSDP